MAMFSYHSLVNFFLNTFNPGVTVSSTEKGGQSEMTCPWVSKEKNLIVVGSKQSIIAGE